MFNQNDDILTVEEMCEILKIGKNSAYKLLNSNAIPAYRNGKIWRIPRTSLIEFVENSLALQR